MPEPHAVVRRSGPLFTGAAAAAVEAFQRAAVEAVAEAGYNDVRAHLGSVLQHPTGYYESRVRTDVETHDRARVHDDRVVYGPWLEGVSSRNQSTRFKGYATFRRVTEQLDRRAAAIAALVLRRFIGRMQ